VYVFKLTYPARNALAPCCHLWPAWLYSTFPHYLINGTRFSKYKIENSVCVLIFSTISVWNIFSFSEEVGKVWSKIYIYIGLLVKYPLFWSYFNEIWIFSTDFRKTDIKFHENPLSGNRGVACGQTDGETEWQS
jgi:hypothetical protein